MTILTPKQQKILAFFLKKETAKSSEVHAEISKSGEPVSLVTIKRALSKLVDIGVLNTTGSGRSAGYTISNIGRIFADVDARDYCSADPDKRYGLKKYNFTLLNSLTERIFSDIELSYLNSATAEYKKRTTELPQSIQKKELERMIIELSWKSSKIEGNTYTLLDTEKLILENKEAEGHSKKEAQMILNHKDAFNYIHSNTDQFKTVTKNNLEDLHAILAKDLGVGLGLREKPVGVVGSIYSPLDNIYQITEAVESLGAAVSRMSTAYDKSLLALLGIGYIQPFEDGNKRTSRLMANAILLAYGLAPLSYRSVDENEYREAMLVFYELNSAMPFKNIFMSQYDFAARNYSVK